MIVVDFLYVGCVLMEISTYCERNTRKFNNSSNHFPFFTTERHLNFQLPLLRTKAANPLTNKEYEDEEKIEQEKFQAQQDPEQFMFPTRRTHRFNYLY